MNISRGNQNSLTLLQQGKNLRENLQFIGSKIAENQMLDAKEKVLEKYKDPVSVFSKQDGSMKSPFEVSQETFPDFMWLQSNGFDKEAKGLEQMFTAYNADLNQKAENSSFLSLLSAEERKKVAKMNFDRTDVADVYSKWKTMEYNTTPKPEKRTKPFAKQMGADLWWFEQDDDGKWTQKVIATNPQWNEKISYNMTPDYEPLMNLDGTPTGAYWNVKTQGPPPKGTYLKKDESKIHGDYIKSEELKIKQQKAKELEEDPFGNMPEIIIK